MKSRRIPGYLAASATLDSGFFEEWFWTAIGSDRAIASFAVIPRQPGPTDGSPERLNARLLLSGEYDRLDGTGRFVSEIIFCDVAVVRIPRGTHSVVMCPDIYPVSSDPGSNWCYDTRELYVESRSIHVRKERAPSAKDLGPSAFIPVDDAVRAVALEDGWRMCDSCLEAWQASTDHCFGYCPKCGALTCLDEPESA